MEMIERVARALCVLHGINPDAIADLTHGPALWNRWKSDAVAAITAMREPTEGMLVAARDWSYKKYGQPIGNDAAIGCFSSMIDAAGQP
jgi:hypothetical protein